MTAHSTPPRGLDAARSPLFQGRFGRMFRNLPPAKFGATESDNLANLAALAEAMTGGDDPPADQPDAEESGIPALYTYFGQFIDHDLTLDPTTREVKRGATILDLTHTEFRVLEFLMRRAGRACSRAAIIDGVWGLEKEVQANAVDVFIRLVRAKLDATRRRPLIHTVRGYGYILRDES